VEEAYLSVRELPQGASEERRQQHQIAVLLAEEVKLLREIVRLLTPTYYAPGAISVTRVDAPRAK
jgi:hypothetical protein